MRWHEYIVGIFGIGALLAVLLYYQNVHILKAAEDPVAVEEEGMATVDGYKEPEETVAYLMSQIAAGDLEKALRSCAIEDVAAYYNMTLYLNNTEKFSGTDMIPPADSDDPAYYNISRIRLAADYGNMIQKCIDRLSSNHLLEIYDIVRDEPENPDGKYFQRLGAISDIVGARDACECIVYMQVDGNPLELHLSLAKYKKYWKIILFTPMAEYESTEPDIREDAEVFGDAPMDLSAYQKELLPMNYVLVNSRTAEEPGKLVKDICMYLQRGDVLSVLTYYDLGCGGGEPNFSLELLNRQKEAVVRLQTFYYRIFLNKADYAWIGRHYYDQPEYIPELLRVTNMQYVNFGEFQIIQEEEYGMVIQIIYSCDGYGFTNSLTLSGRDGWSIQGME